MKRDIRLDVVRVILTILVVIGHASYIKISNDTGLSVDYSNMNVLDPYYYKLISIFNYLNKVIYTFHMPAFFMLSGAVFQITDCNIRLENLMKKKIKRLIKPYFITAILFVIPVYKLSGCFTPDISIVSVINKFFSGHVSNTHLWFLLSLFWCYLWFFILKKIVKNDVVILIITFILNVITPDILSRINDRYNLFNSLNYLFYFAIGYFIWKHRVKFDKIDKKSIYLLYFITFLNFRFNILGIYLTSIFCFLSLYFIAESFTKKSILINSKIYNIILKNSLSIYLLHDPLEYVILYFTNHFNLLMIQGGSILYFFNRTVGVIVLSIIIAYIIGVINKKIHIPFLSF